jgi:predicted XRE-type DNA-binding protein
MKEDWRDIPEYEGLYQVSNHGKIRNIKKGYFGRFLKGSIDKDGYITVGLRKEGKGKYNKVHRLVLTVFDRPPKPGEECNHKDGNKSNNFIENIEWCTHLQNMQHKENVLGKHTRGENQVTHKLTEHDVKEIRVLIKEEKLTQKQIAGRYGVHQSVISSIKFGRTWKHLN